MFKRAGEYIMPTSQTFCATIETLCHMKWTRLIMGTGQVDRWIRGYVGRRAGKGKGENRKSINTATHRCVALRI